MAKYSQKAGEKVEEAMHELKEGKLKSGTGKKVTSRKQAIAIGLSEAREEGAKVPAKKASKKAASKKSSGSKKKSTASKKSSKK
jgi:F0F1-type ATP synthase epsilon subunit